MLQIFPTTLVKLAKSADYNFSCAKLAFQKASIDCKYNLATKLTPYFGIWCPIPIQTFCFIFIPELLRVFEVFSTFVKQTRVYKLA